jgi:hypothetical protein
VFGIVFGTGFVALGNRSAKQSISLILLLLLSLSLSLSQIYSLNHIHRLLNKD